MTRDVLWSHGMRDTSWRHIVSVCYFILLRRLQYGAAVSAEGKTVTEGTLRVSGSKGTFRRVREGTLNGDLPNWGLPRRDGAGLPIHILNYVTPSLVSGQVGSVRFVFTFAKIFVLRCLTILPDAPPTPHDSLARTLGS